LFNNTFALLAAFFMGLSYPSRTFELLIIGRFLSGVNAGTVAGLKHMKLVKVDFFFQSTLILYIVKYILYSARMH